MFTHYSRTRRTVEYATFPLSQYMPTFSQPVLWLSQVFTYSAEAWKRTYVSEHPVPGLLLGEFSFTRGMRCFCLREEPHAALEHLGTAPGTAQQGPSVPALPADAGGCGLWAVVPCLHRKDRLFVESRNHFSQVKQKGSANRGKLPWPTLSTEDPSLTPTHKIQRNCRDVHMQLNQYPSSPLPNIYFPLIFLTETSTCSSC